MDLISHPWLQRVPAGMLAEILSVTTEQQFGPSEMLFDQGSPSDTLYLLLEGELGFWMRVGPDNFKFIRGCKAGESFGELGLIDSTPRTLRAVAKTQVKTAQLPFKELRAIIEKHAGGMVSEIIRNIAGNFRRMTVEFSNEVIEKERIESELRVAREIQMSMLPKVFPRFPEQSDVDLYAIIEPAKQVGGDFYDFFTIDESHMCFSIGDVSDKGVPAALFMAATEFLLRNSTLKGVSPAEILSRVNRTLCCDNEAGLFVTIFCGILNTKTGQVLYSDGGHNPPFFLDGKGNAELLSKEGGSIALGFLPEAEYHERSLRLEPGQMLLYTDGVTEAQDTGQSFYGEARLSEILRSATASTSAKDLTNAVQRSLSSFSAGAPQSDDITAMALRYWVSPAS